MKSLILIANYKENVLSPLVPSHQISCVCWRVGDYLSKTEIMKRGAKRICFIVISSFLCKDERKEAWSIVLGLPLMRLTKSVSHFSPWLPHL